VSGVQLGLTLALDDLSLSSSSGGESESENEQLQRDWKAVDVLPEIALDPASVMPKPAPLEPVSLLTELAPVLAIMSTTRGNLSFQSPIPTALPTRNIAFSEASEV
jgi:hypothetical protein